MRNLKMFSLVLATIAFVGFYACSGGAKKEVKEVTEETVVETETVAADSVAAVDTAMVEEPVAEEPEAMEAE